MLAQDLKRLADVAEVAKLDIAPRPLVLAPTESGTLAWYDGSFSAGGVVVQSTGLSEMVSVSAADFAAIAELFDTNADVTLKVTGNELQLSTRTRKARLRFRDVPSIDRYLQLQATAREGSAKFAPFLKEATLASTVAGTSMSAPILRGIRVVRGKSEVGIQAANGYSSVFETRVPGSTKQRSEVVAPNVDLTLALKVLGSSEDVYFGSGDYRTLVLSNDSAIVKIATLAGQWPDMNHLKYLLFAQSVIIPVPTIKALVTAARVYKSGGDTTLRPGKGETFILETNETENGQFQEVLPGFLTKSYVLDMADLDIAAGMVNDAITLDFSDSMARMTVDGRKLYILTRSQ